MSKPVFIVFFLLCVHSLHAQKQNTGPFIQELTVITENDNYDLELTDRYYSNGFLIQYNRVAEAKHTSVAKKILLLQAAHQVYNPYTNRHSVQNVLSFMDRPFAGWFSLSAGMQQITTKGNVLQYGAAVGVMGPSAKGEQIQTGWHKIIGLYKVYGWGYELNNEWGLNAAGGYYHTLLNSRENRNLSIHTVTRATLGNTFTNASAGFLVKTGWLNREHESGYWSGNLGATSSSFKRNEFIFFAEPVLQYQAYNATIQGGLFTNDKGLFTTGIQPLVFQTKTGIMFTGNRMGLRWYYTFRTKEGSRMRKGEHWGSIGLSYRFR